MYFRYWRSAVAIGLVVFGLAGTVSAQSNQSSCQQVYPGDASAPDATAAVSLKISNPGYDSVNTKGVFDIPSGITPINLGAGQSFSGGVLTVNIGTFPANTEKAITVDYQGKPAACVVYGTMSGTWSPKPEAGPATWSQEINFSVILPTSGSAANPNPGSTNPGTNPGGGVNPVPPSGGNGTIPGTVIPAPSSAPGVFAPVDQVSTSVTSAVKTVSQTVATLRTNQIAQQASRPASITAGVVGAAATAASVPWWSLFQFMNLGALGALKKKERKPWGIVFDKATRRPISGASVKLFDAVTKKQKNVEITDSDGRFGFLVPAGLYYVRVTRSGFGAYDSTFIKVTNEQTEALNIEIPLEPERAHFIFIKSVFAGIKNFFESGSFWLLIFGTLFSVVIFALFPNPLHLGILIFYIVIDVVKLVLDSITGRSFGRVTDPVTGQPIPLAVVRVFESRFNYLLFTYVTDRNGRFKFLVTPGDYYVTCSKPGFTAYTSEQIPIRKSDVIKLDIPLAPEAAGVAAVGVQ